MSEEHQAQIDQLLKTQAKMQTDLTQCETKIKAQEQLIQRLITLLGYSCSGMGGMISLGTRCIHHARWL